MGEAVGQGQETPEAPTVQSQSPADVEEADRAAALESLQEKHGDMPEDYIYHGDEGVPPATAKRQRIETYVRTKMEETQRAPHDESHGMSEEEFQALMIRAQQGDNIIIVVEVKCFVGNPLDEL